jgi:hypothetical protein
MVEIVVVALIAGTSMIFVLSLGQANAQLSQINAESIFARQIAMDLLEYYANHPDDAKLQWNTGPQPPEIFQNHLAFKDTLSVSPDAQALYRKMNPQVFLMIEPNVGYSGRRYVDLHRIDCSVKWTEDSGDKDKDNKVNMKRERTLTVSRLVSDIR